MKKLLMCTCTALVFLIAAAVAQTNPSTDTTSPGSQGTTSSSPAMGQQTPTQDTTQGNGAGGNGSMTSNTSTSAGMKGDKGDKKMKGCIQSQGGQYMLQSKHGNVMLAGQDVSAHVGHEVTVHGTWEGSGNMSGSSSSSSMASGKSFNVTAVDMISETCSMGKGKTSGTSSTQPQ